MAESTPLYNPTYIVEKYTLDSIFANDLFSNVERIQVYFCFARMFSFVLDDDFGCIDWLDDS